MTYMHTMISQIIHTLSLVGDELFEQSLSTFLAALNSCTQTNEQTLACKINTMALSIINSK